MAKELIDIAMVKHHQTELAILVSDDGDREKAIWLPLSRIEIEPQPGSKGIVIVTMPVSLATDKGLI